VLDHLARLAKWEKRPSPQKPITGNLVKGRGCSYVKYELVRTYIGAVAEVEVDRATGEIRVSKFYVVHDCGQIVNPNGVKAQIEGCVIQTVSRALKEELTFDRSMVTSLDWASYPILTFPEVPEIEIELIDRPTEKCGERENRPRHWSRRRYRTQSSMRPACDFARCRSNGEK
jgi:nicotinate dehydrogenase subunit B